METKQTSTDPRYSTPGKHYLHKKVQYLHSSQVTSQAIKNFQQLRKKLHAKAAVSNINPIYTG
jgi:hypothetical protein